MYNVVVGKPPHTTKLYLLFNHTMIIVDHFMYQAYTFFIKHLDFKFILFCDFKYFDLVMVGSSGLGGTISNQVCCRHLDLGHVLKNKILLG